jgi:hypothetical protein
MEHIILPSWRRPKKARGVDRTGGEIARAPAGTNGGGRGGEEGKDKV